MNRKCSRAMPILLKVEIIIHICVFLTTFLDSIFYKITSNDTGIIPIMFCVLHCPKFKAEFPIMERTVDGMKLHKEKYSRDFIPYNLPELFQGSEKL